MNADLKISVDIGSTWTKAARFRLDGNFFVVEEKVAVPTTIDYLPDGFYAALEKVAPEINPDKASGDEVKIYFSSSARGGLKVSVIGLVPEMSLKIGRLAACSAGARITSAYPYRLTKSAIKEIEQQQPDILLLCGGTDGGNERYIRQNSDLLAGSNFRGTVIYAGNSYASDYAKEALSGFDLRICSNLMPDFGKLNVDPVRACIREVFLDSIVHGKGLNHIIDRFKAEPLPTPMAVFKLVKALGGSSNQWRDFALVDMGGATTDFYSYTEAFKPDSGVVLKGIEEPELKRSVEGDLGMRVSAEATLAAGRDFFKKQLDDIGKKYEDFEAYVKHLSKDTSFIPENKSEKEFDEILANYCIYLAMLRHSGEIEQVYTLSGPVWAQKGKDLRQVKRIVGTGGFLAEMGRNPVKFLKIPAASELQTALIPENFEFFADSEYLIPLLGNLAVDFPEQVAKSIERKLTSINIIDQAKESNHCEFKQVK
ncbi:MAG: glutamate mutase L [Candidatus Rifleibacteriota bacterium]